MKKFAVMVLAVMLAVVMASGALAVVVAELAGIRDEFRVGNDAKEDAGAYVWVTSSAVLVKDYYSFRVIGGELPPDCSLEQDGDKAYIKGKLTKEGHYSFTVYIEVTGHDFDVFSGRRYTQRDFGSVLCFMDVLPARDTAPDSQDIPTPEPDPSQDIPAPIPSNDIPAPVPNPKPQAVGVIANKLGISSADVEYVASSDMKAVQPPTASITNALSSDGREIISTQGSITAQKTGCYVFPLTVPADLVGTNTELKVYLADRSIFTGASFRSSALPAGITEAQIFTESGGTVTTLPGNILVAANLQANTATTFSTHITKTLSQSNNNDNTDNNANTNNDNTDNNDNTNNDNTNDNDNADNNSNTDNSNTDNSSGGGGGGCNTFPLISALILTALTAITKSKR